VVFGYFALRGVRSTVLGDAVSGFQITAILAALLLVVAIGNVTTVFLLRVDQRRRAPL